MIEFGIGVDLGGTNLRAAAIDRTGHLLDKPISVDTNYHGGREAVISDIVNAVTTLKQQFASARLAGVGIGVPGFIRLREGFITNSNNLPYLENFPVRDEIEKRLGTPIILENDANAAALGETWQGAGRDVDSLVLLTLGTGIGGGIVIDGRLRLGPLSAAGEIGHQTVMPNGPLCACGNPGCLEVIAAGPAIARAAGYPDTESAATAARNGDPRAQQAFREAAFYLGIAAANLVTALHPDALLFSGGMSELVDLLLMPVRAAVNERVRMFPADGVAVRRAAAGPNAGLLGALALNIAPEKIAL